MARYGNDFTSGRYMRYDRNQEPMGSGYDFGYRGADRWGGGYSSGRGHGWGDFEGNRGWSARNRNSSGDLDESWGSMGHGGGRRDYGEGHYGTPGAGYGRSGSTFGAGSAFGQARGSGQSRYGGPQRNFYDRDMNASGGRIGQDYDEDFGDRLRQGWNRFRQEARGWMGRYDRGW